MRISDWISDVCSSDLAAPAIVGAAKLLPLTGTTLPSLSMAFTPQAATDSVRSASEPGTPLPANGDRSALRQRPKRNQYVLAKAVPTMLCAKLLVSKLSSPRLFESEMTTRRLLLRTWENAARRTDRY